MSDYRWCRICGDEIENGHATARFRDSDFHRECMTARARILELIIPSGATSVSKARMYAWYFAQDPLTRIQVRWWTLIHHTVCRVRGCVPPATGTVYALLGGCARCKVFPLNGSDQ